MIWVCFGLVGILLVALFNKVMSLETTVCENLYKLITTITDDKSEQTARETKFHSLLHGISLNVGAIIAKVEALTRLPEEKPVRVPFNKGQALSEEHKKKLSIAQQKRHARERRRLERKEKRKLQRQRIKQEGDVIALPARPDAVKLIEQLVLEHPSE
mgnify:CR=1 FL=1